MNAIQMFFVGDGKVGKLPTLSVYQKLPTNVQFTLDFNEDQIKAVSNETGLANHSILRNQDENIKILGIVGGEDLSKIDLVPALQVQTFEAVVLSEFTAPVTTKASDDSELLPSLSPFVSDKLSRNAIVLAALDTPEKSPLNYREVEAGNSDAYLHNRNNDARPHASEAVIARVRPKVQPTGSLASNTRQPILPDTSRSGIQDEISEYPSQDNGFASSIDQIGLIDQDTSVFRSNENENLSEQTDQKQVTAFDISREGNDAPGELILDSEAPQPVTPEVEAQKEAFAKRESVNETVITPDHFDPPVFPVVKQINVGTQVHHVIERSWINPDYRLPGTNPSRPSSPLVPYGIHAVIERSTPQPLDMEFAKSKPPITEPLPAQVVSPVKSASLDNSFRPTTLESFSPAVSQNDSSNKVVKKPLEEISIPREVGFQEAKFSSPTAKIQHKNSASNPNTELVSFISRSLPAPSGKITAETNDKFPAKTQEEFTRVKTETITTSTWIEPSSSDPGTAATDAPVSLPIKRLTAAHVLARDTGTVGQVQIQNPPISQSPKRDDFSEIQLSTNASEKQIISTGVYVQSIVKPDASKNTAHTSLMDITNLDEKAIQPDETLKLTEPPYEKKAYSSDPVLQKTALGKTSIFNSPVSEASLTGGKKIVPMQMLQNLPTDRVSEEPNAEPVKGSGVAVTEFGKAAHLVVRAHERYSIAPPAPPANPILRPAVSYETIELTVAEDSNVQPFSPEIGQIHASGQSSSVSPAIPQFPMEARNTRFIAQQLAAQSKPLQDGAIELTLQPEELGRIRMTMTASETGLHVTVIAERPETMDLLRRSIDVLTQEFRSSGHQTTTFDFGQPRNDGSRHDTTTKGKQYESSFNGLSDEDSVLPSAVTSDGGVDLRL